LGDEVRQQRGKTPYLDAGKIRQRQSCQLDAFGMRESRPLSGALGHAHDDVLEQRCGAQDQITVPVGDRIESARVDGDALAWLVHGLLMAWRLSTWITPLLVHCGAMFRRSRSTRLNSP